MTIFGRRHAVGLVREVMSCPADGPAPPVLVFEADRGGGKSALLTALTGLLDGRVPYAHVDLAATGRTGTPEVLYALAFHLGRPCPLYGTLRFPRLAVGKLVMENASLDLHDRERARRQINALLRTHRGIDNLVTTLRDGAGNLPAGLPASVQAPLSLVPRILATLVSRLASWRWSSPFVLGRAQKWYGTQGSHRRPAVETLIELNQWHRRPNLGNNARQRDELLWAAFRADLVAGLGRRRRRTWLPRCVVLLDNADTRLGRHFLTELVRLRAAGESDPLAVVATAREPFGEHFGTAEQRILESDEPLLLRRPGPGTRQWPRWARYALPRLTDTDVVQQVSTAHPSLDRRLPLQVQQFAQGNPAAVSLLLASAAEVSSWPAGGNELGVVLARREPPPPDDTDRVQCTIEERISRHLLGLDDGDPFPDDDVETLTTCAAARTVEQAMTLAVGSGLLTPDGYTGKLSALLAQLWPDDADGDANVRPTNARPGNVRHADARHADGRSGNARHADSRHADVHPADTRYADIGPPPLRRLLLRRLAARRPQAQHGWAKVHGRLRTQCAEQGDRVGELYHALALGRLGQVADWLATLRAVAQAPTNLPHSVPPADEAYRLARATGAEPDSRLGRVTRLLAGLWLAADPFTGRHRADLHDDIKRDFRAVALQFPDDRSLLVAEATRHKALADLWR
ncbi:hypothetical protein [Micromonospora yangpuensis]|uniref:AAA ATPase domain-containing protein n=1 Tax=Micromonospora yangpuensis TaxID=683228 RepID=A0A1C6UB67_9ACTN|nr:hypothetical protein [Micromonospora yangpuensis]GGL87267.1 hypothetical protein GCM10012279_01160 [Micromonospora yangpuensis]SCL51161.1 hypothetical protein GA0070617_1699 [Micromonospora yangpuensis]